MKILSFNVRAWTRDTDNSSEYYWKTRMSAVGSMIEDTNPDVICFQELVFPANLYIPSGYRRVNLSVSHPIYVRKGIKTSHHKFRVFFDSVNIEQYQIINVHGRWEAKITDRIVNSLLKASQGKSTIICGDFNNGSKDLMDRGFPENVRTILGIEHQPTFYHFTKPPIPDYDAEVDHFFCLHTIVPKSFRVITENYGCKRMSDHLPILMEI